MPYGNMSNSKTFNYNKRFSFSSSSPLDTYKDNVVMGFSYYKLLSSYKGYCLRVRRSLDDAEQDFGFVAGYIDSASIIAFCGANDGYVSIWYNQYTSGNNAVQDVVATRQPKIVSSGVFYPDGMFYSVAAASNLRILNYAALNIRDQPLGLYANYNSTNAGVTGYVFYRGTSSSNTTQYGILKTSTPNNGFVYGTGVGFSALAQTACLTNATNKILYNWIDKSTNGLTSNTNNGNNTATLAVQLLDTTNVFIGVRSNAADGSSVSALIEGYIKSIIVFNINVEYSKVSKV